ncbi:MAG: insulinase family protein [Anaerolineae bacterium]|nr:insulinase family protein [Anaerolineae bacterium]
MPNHDLITRTVLPNGLTIMLKEMHAAPVTSLCVWYRVGSRNERLGCTGISHWVEHMMFKGTARYDETEMDRLISREGGTRNAFTWIDFTAYYETMPANKIDLAIAIESDRMANTQFSRKEVESERTVIINERQMYENSPNFRLVEEVQAAAFRVHPYGHEVIGHMNDLHTMTRADLIKHYRTYYAPNNAIVCVAGDFDNAEMLGKLEQTFGTLKNGKAVPAVNVTEPPQVGERRVTVKGEGATNYLMMSFHVPAAKHPDYFPLVALDSVLCGASGLAFFGGGTSNRSSRLSKALVDTGLTADIGGGLSPTIDPNLYSFFATVQPGQAIGDAERAIWAQLEQVKTEGVTQAELDKAIKQTRAQFAFSTETVTNQAFWLGYSEIVADYAWFTDYVNQLKAVTADDVRRVANLYLQPDNVTTGYYLGQG